MTRFALLVSLVILFNLAAGARPAAAQERPTTTIAGGYSYLRALGIGGGPDTDYSTGWFASASHRLLMDRLSGIGEVSCNSRENLAIEHISVLAILGGGRLSLLRAWGLDAYAQALVGMERFKEPGFSDRALAVQPGFGVDIPLVKSLGARVQADYRFVSSDDVTVKEYRVVAGGVVSFGR